MIDLKMMRLLNRELNRELSRAIVIPCTLRAEDFDGDPLDLLGAVLAGIKKRWTPEHEEKVKMQVEKARAYLDHIRP